MSNIGFPSGGHANQGWKLYLASLIMILFAGLFVIVRIATRMRTGKLGGDDYTIILSLMFSIVLSVNIQLAVVHGYGRHQKELSKKALSTCLKFFWISQTPYKIVVCLNKTSVVLLYKRIFITPRFQWLCYGVLAVVISSGVATTFATIFQCIPIRKSWNKSLHGTCIDNTKFWLANAIINIGTDVLVLALPVREIFRLHLKLQEKLMLLGIFMLGGFVTITSILRVTAVANSAKNQADQTWNFIPRGVWTLIEANLGIICTCLPVLKQLVKRVFPSMFTSSKATPGSSRPYGYGSKTGSSRRDGSSRLHDEPDEEAEVHGYNPLVKNTWGGSSANKSHQSYPMSPLPYGREPSSDDERRKSDEKRIISPRTTELSRSDGSIEGSENHSTGWVDQSGITVTKTVNIHVANSGPIGSAK